MTPRKIKRYGWKPSLPDHRNLKFADHHLKATPPSSFDLTAKCPPVYDQGELGSCTANAGGALAEFLTMKLGFKNYMPARLAIYYWERVIEGTTSDDAGATISDLMKVLKNKGTPNENIWQYNVSKFAVAPTKKVEDNAKLHQLTTYYQVNQNLNEMKVCVSGGFPIVLGFTVYESFESDQVAQTGIVPMPSKNEDTVGGHAVMVVGYDDSKKLFKVRNSWGRGWGQEGYFQIPYDYFLNPDLANDFWTATGITGWKGN